MIVLGTLGMTLMQSTDEGTITVSVELANGTTLEDTNKLTLEVEKMISENKNVDKVFTTVGSGSMSILGHSSANSSSITVVLKKCRKASTDDVEQEIREALSNVVGAVITVSKSSTMSMGSGGLEFEFTGTDDKLLA